MGESEKDCISEISCKLNKIQETMEQILKVLKSIDSRTGQTVGTTQVCFPTAISTTPYQKDQ